MGWRTIKSVPKDEERAILREFRKKARFLVDESLGVGVAEQLREWGWNVKYAEDVGLKGRSDQDVIAHAHRHDRILLTHDKHFWDDRDFPEHRNPGIVILPGGSGNEEALYRALSMTVSLVGGLRELHRKAKVSISSDEVLTVKSRDRSTGAIKETRYRFTANDDLQEWEG